LTPGGKVEGAIGWKNQALRAISPRSTIPKCFWEISIVWFPPPEHVTLSEGLIF
jgi:hypothetical protein